MFTDDPIADFDMYDAEYARWLTKRPICSECGEHIQDEYCYSIDGKYICHECLDDEYRVYID